MPAFRHSRMILTAVVILFGAFSLSACLGGSGTVVRFTLTMQKQGEGTVTPAEGQHQQTRDTVVNLLAQPAADWTFSHWEGNVAAPNQPATTIVMNADQVVTAFFDEEAVVPPNHTWDVEGVVLAMRPVPQARFPIGVQNDDTALVTADFLVGETEVTYALWYAVRLWAIGHGYAFHCQGTEGHDGATGPPTGDRNEPVVNISWRDCIVWCNALSEYLNLDPVYTHDAAVIKDAADAAACDQAVAEGNDGFRLLTADEWELAARYLGPLQPETEPLRSEAVHLDGLYWTPGSYASGASAGFQDAAATDLVAWYAHTGTVAVAQKQPNALGIHDMSGNAAEWCFTARGTGRVDRGGSWADNAAAMVVGWVHSLDPAFFYPSVGFRLGKSAD